MVKDDLWLGRILGRSAVRVDTSNFSDLSVSLKSRLKSEAVFATAKVPTSRPDIAHELEEVGFRVVDTALTFRCEGVQTRPSDAGRFAVSGDRDRVVTIAGSAFRYSRFHLDPAIPATLANRVKADWAGNYFAGRRGDAMVIAEENGQVAGFLLLARTPGGGVAIDLIAVDPSFARRGLARSMIAYAARCGIDEGGVAGEFMVGTQAANVPSVNLYESLGFRLSSSEFVLHHHGTGGVYSEPGSS